MSIIRVEKNAQNPFVMIDRRQIQRNDLSFRARGLYAYLLSMPNDWRISVSDLVNRAPEGRHAIQGALKELKEHGYIKVEAIRGEGGKMEGSKTTFFECPHPAEMQIIRDAENPSVGESATTYTTTYIEEVVQERLNQPRRSTAASSTVLGDTSQAEQPETEKRDDDAAQILVSAFMEKSARQPFTNAQRARGEIPAILQDLSAYAEHVGTNTAKSNIQTAIDQMISEGDPPHCITGALIRAKRNNKTTPAPKNTVDLEAERAARAKRVQAIVDTLPPFKGWG